MDIRRAETTPFPFARHRFTVAEVEAMQAAGVIDPGDYELIDGDLCTVAAQKNDHELVKNALARQLARALPDATIVAIESTLFLGPQNASEPDIMLYPRELLPEDVRCSDVLLLIEVADETLAKDLGRKAQLYAEAGVRECWIVDAKERRTHVHRGPLPSGEWSERESS
jgi:Uma2 family endonuclease